MAVSSPHRPLRETPEAFERRTATRLWWVCAGLIGGHVLLLSNLYRVQIVRHEELSNESLKHWQRIETLRPERGLIYDRNGALLVQNEPGFAVIVDPSHWFFNNSLAPDAQDQPADRRKRALQALRQVFPDADLTALEELDLGLPPPRKAFEIKSWVSAEVVEQIRQAGVDLAVPVSAETRTEKKARSQIKEEIPGVSFPATTRRVALHGTRASHILGFIDPQGRQPSRGIEASQDKILKGTKVMVQYEFDGSGLIPGTERPFPQTQGLFPLGQRPYAIDGSDVTLTIDAELQHDVEQAIGVAVKRHQAEAGVAIVLDANNGDILAMASAPTYNVNEARERKGPGHNANKDRINWSLELPYEPGSTLKTLTLAAALQERLVSPTTTFSCSGSRRILNRTIHCAAHGPFTHGHGQQDLLGVLKYSCNLATAECGERLGAKRLYHYFTDFGLGTRTDIGLPEEAPGKLKNPKTSTWHPIDLANRSFGQGISVTPLQLAAAYTTFVEGTYHPPRLVQSYRQPKTGKVTQVRPAPGRSVLSETTARQMREMLRAVVEPKGTGQAAQVTGYTAGGKTGTAQISDDGRHYSGRFAASFIGLAPLDKPQFVILTMIRGPKGADHFGGSVAGPLFKEIAEKALLLRRIPHDKLDKSQPDPTEKKHQQSSAVEG